MKNELVDVLHRSSVVVDSRISDLEIEIQRYKKEKDQIEAKLEEACKEPGMDIWSRYSDFTPAAFFVINKCVLIFLMIGRKEIIAEFKALVSSFPEKMGSMQNQLAKHKDTAAEIYSLRADVGSLSNILDRKVMLPSSDFCSFLAQSF